MFMNALSTSTAEIATIEVINFCLRPPKSTRDIHNGRVLAGVDLRHEVLVTGKNDDQHEIGGEDHVDQAEHAEDDLVLGRRPKAEDEDAEHLEEVEHEDEQRGDEAQIERRQEPAAAENDRFNQILKSPCFCLRSQAETWHVLHVLTLGDEFREGDRFLQDP